MGEEGDCSYNSADLSDSEVEEEFCMDDDGGLEPRWQWIESVVGMSGELITNKLSKSFSKVQRKNMGYLYQGWCFTSNSSCHNGGRVILAWKPN